VGAYDLGVSLLKSGRVEQAMPQLERAIQLDPKFWGSYYYLGKATLQTHHAEQAIPLLRQAVALNAKSAEACYELGRALMATGQNAEAEQAMQRVKQLRELEVARDVEMLRRK
jgi:tetratricopeptide (TPR) repeat protein